MWLSKLTQFKVFHLAEVDRPFTKPRLAGFTLIELVLAIALASLLMVAILGVIRLVSAQVTIASQSKDPLQFDSTTHCLRRDLLACSFIQKKDGWLWLHGSFHSSVADAGLHSRVGYGVLPWLDNNTVLVRRTNDGDEIIMFGLRRIVLERLDDEGIPQPLSNDLASVPSRVRVWLWDTSSQEDKANFEFDINIH